MTKFLKDCGLEFRDKRIQIGQEENGHMKQFTNELSLEMRFIIYPPEDFEFDCEGEAGYKL